MRLGAVLLAMAFIGCNKPDTGGVTSTSVPPATTSRSLVHSGKPEFDEMIAALQADPKAAKYKNQFLSIDIEVDEASESKKDQYLVIGRVGAVTIRVTFIVLPDLHSNEQARNLAKGDRVDFYGELAKFEPDKSHPVVTILSGSISRVSRKPK